MTCQSRSAIIVNEIEDNKVTVKDDIGKETTIDVKDVKDTKVGDMDKIIDGIIEKLIEKSGKYEKPEKAGY